MDSKHLRLIALCGTVLFWAFASAPVAAQDACAIPSVTSADEAIPKFDELRRHECLGGNQCRTGECLLVADVLSKNSGPAGVPPDQMLAVLGKLADASAALSDSRPGVAQLHGMLIRWKLKELAAKEPAAAMTEILGSNTREWDGRNFLIFPDTPMEIDAQKQLSECASPDSCNASFASLVSVYTLSEVVSRTLGMATRAQMEEAARTLHRLDERWTAFHVKSLAVLPWELAFNNLFYKSARAGFSGPPSYQWLLLHPSAALVYDSRQSDKFQPALLMDVIGRYQWTWGGPNNSDITVPFGIALAMSWHGNSPGYGLAVHLPRNWSLGVTTSHSASKGTQVQLIVSAEVAQFVTDKQKNVDDLRAALEKPR